MFLPELLALLFYPLLSWQGRRVRQTTPRLPEASGHAHGVSGPLNTPHGWRVLAIGESPVAGVGVNTYAQSITAQFAQALAKHQQVSVTWQALGQNGACLASAGDSLARLNSGKDVAGKAWDIVIIAFGVNDTTGFTSVARYRQQLHDLIRQLERGQQQPPVMLISGVPPMQYFPALPRVLRFILGMKARVLDQVAKDLCASEKHLIHVPLQMNFQDRHLMAEDGYHPSALGNTVWAQQLLGKLLAIFPQNRQEI
ncbi:SGNH/GDSL hydrolase family protein [Undibacterium sp. TJN19]|uniref:SGNH/GDSL hydrolase family protein n=1 Tax=Undibacterium sp. TJN19 TaxID=3413055 RepID=UPI003BF2000B